MSEWWLISPVIFMGSLLFAYMMAKMITFGILRAKTQYKRWLYQSYRESEEDNGRESSRERKD